MDKEPTPVPSDVVALVDMLIQAAREREAATRLPDCVEGAETRLQGARSNLLASLASPPPRDTLVEKLREANELLKRARRYLTHFGSEDPIALEADLAAAIEDNVEALASIQQPPADYCGIVQVNEEDFAPTKDRETASPASEDVREQVAAILKRFGYPAPPQRALNKIAALASPTPRDTLADEVPPAVGRSPQGSPAMTGEIERVARAKRLADEFFAGYTPSHRGQTPSDMVAEAFEWLADRSIATAPERERLQEALEAKDAAIGEAFDLLGGCDGVADIRAILLAALTPATKEKG